MNEAARRELDALLRLLSDPDPAVAEPVLRRLRELGTIAAERLRAFTEAADPVLRRRARDFLAARASEAVLAEAEAVAAEPFDLERWALLLAALEDPTTDRPAASRRLDELAARIRERAEPALMRARKEDEPFAVPSAQVAALQLLGVEFGFRGDEENYYDPRNSSLCEVLARRQGIPISLSVVYLLVAQRLGWRLEGVGMPMHFLVRLVADEAPLAVVLLDPFRKGAVITPEACRKLLARHGKELSPRDLDPVTPIEILTRMVANLVRIRHEREDQAHLSRLYAFARLLPPVENPPS